MRDHYAVIGNPVQHSKSPQIHAMFAAQTGQHIDYGRVLAAIDSFSATIHSLREQGYRGANVTVPFKLEAFALSGQLSERAHDAGAVNTLIFNEHGITGDNTDGAGLVRDIQHNLQRPLQGQRILLIGAGGAAEGVLHPLLEQQPQLLVITNRTLDKALRMIRRVEQRGDLRYVSVNAQAFEALAGQTFDIVINATSTGLSDSQLPLPEQLFAAGALAYDMMYGRETPFMAYARQQGAAMIADGLGMLVEQAAEAFLVWRGIRPQTVPVIAALRG
ncbi:shikimate dehydrogenase [Methylobacillus flagellatus]|uniref:shikimate dehydrogenase n=1 Tax=Methylobacillus flagellatus TaxID=405 RepID=UPI0010F45D55|nr:shikimate dehydrogenase [Methylobacillus flagellatus]